MLEPGQRQRSGIEISARLIGLVKPMLPTMILAIFMGVLGFLAAIFITILGGFGLLHLLGEPTRFSLPFLFGAMLVLALVRGLLGYGEQAANHEIAFRILAILRDKVFRALRRLAPAKLESKEKGNLISLITTDIELIEVFYAHTVSPVAIATVVSLLMLVFFAYFHWVYVVIAALGYLMVGVVIPVIISHAGKAYGFAYREQSGLLSSTLLDNLRGLKEVLQFRQGEERLKKMQEQTQSLGEKKKKITRYEGLTTALCNSVIVLFSLTVLLVGTILYQRGAVGFGGVLLPFLAMIGSFGPVVALANLSNNLLQTFASADRVLTLLEEAPMTPEITQGEDVTFQCMDCQRVDFAYEDEPIIKDFSLHSPKDTILGIQGKSGSGKSTLLRLLMRFWDVDSGEVSMTQRSVKNINTASLRENQGFVTQETDLFHDTIEGNIKVGNLSATPQQVEEACKKASIHEFIVSLPQGYQTNVGELGDTLSGGERQRIGLARAFLHDAPLLLLDEPTSNLDSLNEGIILRSLAEERSHKAVVLVSHRFSTLGIADQVIQMPERRES